MGTRAVIQFNESRISDGGVHEIWYATHWDGHPETLGQDLVKAVQKAKGKTKEYTDEDINIRELRDQVEDVAHDHSIDMKETGSVSGNVEEDFKDRYADYGEFEYMIVKRGGEVRVKHRTVGGFWDDNPTKGEWKDTAREIGMTYTPYSIYRMYYIDDEDTYKIKKSGNKEATATGRNPEELWKEGIGHVDNNVPASLHYYDEDDNVVKDYSNEEVGSR